MKTLENMKKELATKLDKIEMMEQLIDNIQDAYKWKFYNYNEGEWIEKTDEELDMYKSETEEHSYDYRLKQFVNETIEQLIKSVK